MEQSTTANQIFITSWPPSCSSEASASYSLSAASSAIISPACDAQCESSAHTDSSPLKEHDYIGLAEISSTASYSKTEQRANVYSGNDEPDLRLGLGPSATKGMACGEGSSHVVGDLPRRDVIVIKDAPTCSNLSIKRQDVKAVQCFGVVDSSTKSTKRPFSDTRVEVIPDIRLAAAGGDDMKPGVVLTSGQLRMVMQMPDLSKHPQMVYWASPPRGSSWHPERPHTLGSFGQLASGKLVKSNPDCATPSGNLVIRNLEPVPDEGPLAKEQVVGWPPIRSYRRSAIAARSSRHAENECDVQSTTYVKVNMDGIPIGRKVDLNAYSSYEELLSALEGMFHSPHIGEKLRFLHARDFALTYEDKEGDWMLVGDVPWSMFVTTVKRLRIMRGSDPNCLGSSTSKNLS